MLSKRTLVILLALATLALVSSETAHARLARSHSLEPGCCAPPPCPEPCIKYHHKGPKLCCGCEPGSEIVLTVCNPCTGCKTDVPVCLPACCEGEPSVCNGKGFLCRDTIEYEWCCGFYVRVAFKKCGDLVVTTWGR